MFGSVILEVAIGVVLVFLLVSIIASAIREVLESILHTRAGYLERGIRELLHDKAAPGGGLAHAFYTHPLIASLYTSDYVPGNARSRIPMFMTGRRLPAYIPAKNFAIALMDIAVRGPLTDAVSGASASPEFNLQNMRRNISQLENPAVQRVLLTAIDAAQGDLNQAQLSIQAWFDSGMDRVSGWYKRSTSFILFWVGLFVAVLLNIDAIAVARYLYHDDAARKVVVAEAEKASGDSAHLAYSFAQARRELAALDLPIGREWKKKSDSTSSASDSLRNTAISSAPTVWYQPIPGWLITALAATFGAPFWFDLLNKIMVIRSTVKPHEKSPEESSEDRQRPQSANDEAAPATTRTPAPVEPMMANAAPRSMSFSAAPAGTLRDSESGIDACDVEMDPAKSPSARVTADEDLPQAEGGVA